jgi:anthranilate phosphoribosyltransferase
MSAPSAAPSWFAPTLNALLERRDLDPLRMGEVMSALLSGELGEAETAALLVALRMKGETGTELAAAASVIRRSMTPVETGRDDLLDTCGTGGDDLGTFNISTATALVAAAAGVPVVKHGNRAVSGRCGSADVLLELGLTVEISPAVARRCLDTVGMAFCFAPQFHPALRQVGSIRRRLGVRTLFNCLGPLANPAGATSQLLGVGRAEWLERMAAAVACLGTRHALLVCGRDGLDEVSLSGPTLVREVRDGQVTEHEWSPCDFGLAPCALAELRADGPAESARVIRAVLDGEDGAPLRVVLANTAAALWAADRVASLPEGVRLAREVISAGQARRVLDELIVCCKAPRSDSM